jgi:signal transduction histidine kinase
MRRAVLNVVSNALQAMDESETNKPILRVETGVRKGRVEMCFTDNGIGIPQEFKEKIFEPLFSSRSVGVGLGMSIIKNVMVDHDGDVGVESRHGEGTRIILWLPYTET